MAIRDSRFARLPANEPYPDGCLANCPEQAKEVRDEELLNCDATMMNLTERRNH
jgi:hypothetical protein